MSEEVALMICEPRMPIDGCASPLWRKTRLVLSGVCVCWAGVVCAATETYDLSDPAPSIVVFEDDRSSRHGGESLPLALLCRSESDASRGACATALSRDALDVGQESDIYLAFTEKSRGDTVTLALKAYKRMVSAAQSRQLALDGLASDMPDGKVLTYKIFAPQQALSQIPFGGIWEAGLSMEWMAYDGIRMPFDIPLTLQVTDERNVQVSFPGEGGGVPQVNFLLRTAGERRLAATESLRACLYDGYSLHSTAFRMTFSDGEGAVDGGFYLRHVESPASLEERARIEYRVRMSTPGAGGAATIPVDAGRDVTVPGVASDPLSTTLVSVRGHALPCAPWEIDLEIPAFDVAEKIPGDYRGILRLVFTPTTATGG